MFNCNICDKDMSYFELKDNYYCYNHYNLIRSALIKEGNSEYLHYDVESIICPYCGYEYKNSGEMIDSGIEECENCYKEFKFERDIEVSYSTYKL